MSRPRDARTDSELLAAVQRADAKALGELYLRHAPRMLGVARRVLGTELDAEDVLQEVFLEVWQRARTFDAARGGARTWLFVRVRSRALDRRRAVLRARASPLELDEALEPATPPPNEDEIALRRAVRHLPRELGELVALGYRRGLSSSEMATSTGIPIGTVKSRVARALTALRGALSIDESETSKRKVAAPIAAAAVGKA